MTLADFILKNIGVICFFVLQEFKGYVFKIMGGCDKQGFPMKQGVLTSGRVRLLLHRGIETSYVQCTLNTIFYSDSYLNIRYQFCRHSLLPWLWQA
jgi:hypothetical protein